MTATSAAQRSGTTPARGGLADAHFARIAASGTASHAHLAALLDGSGAAAARDLADAIHLLCQLYGRHPGLIDLALVTDQAGPAREWLAEAADQFERERHYLVSLTAAVGPLPSTAGAAETEAALQAQRHAVDTLAQSERRGCALGAAIALVGDWTSIRPLLDRAAVRAGLDVLVSTLPGDSSIARVIDAALDGPASARALTFGAEQMLLQHRGLFDLLEARASARLD